MSEERPPFTYEGLDPAPAPKSTIAEVSEAVKGTVNRISDTLEAGRKPGMPLSVLNKHRARSAAGFAVGGFSAGHCRRASPMIAVGS